MKAATATAKAKSKAKAKVKTSAKSKSVLSKMIATEEKRKRLEKTRKSFMRDVTKSLTIKQTYGKQKAQNGFMKINKDYAELLLEANVANNRNIGRVNLVKICQAMENDTFMPLNGQSIVIGINSNTKELELLDGQHRLQAVFNTDSSYNFQTTLIHNIEDDIFLTMDSGKSRTPQDHFKVTGRNPDLATTARVGYGYQTNKRSLVSVNVDIVTLAEVYDKNPSLESFYNKVKNVIKPTDGAMSVRADVLYMDQAVYFVLHMINTNFGKTGKLFVNSVLCLDQSKLDKSLTPNQKKCIKHLHWMFNGLNRGFDTERTKHNINLYKNDSKIRRCCKSVILSKAFDECFKTEGRIFGKRRTTEMFKNPKQLTQWPDLGTFNV